MKKLNLLVFADVNLNIMDGSSVWLAELLKLLTSDPRVNVDFLSKAPNQGGPLNETVADLPRFKRIEQHAKPMKLDQVVAAIKELDSENNYDRVLVRGGIELGKQLIGQLKGRLAFYTLEPFQRMADLTTTEKLEISDTLNNCAFAIVQSERMRLSYAKEFNVPAEHLFVLPPLIPPIMQNPAFRNKLNTVCYTGKFSEEWGTPGLLDCFRLLKTKLPYAKLNVAGNKFHGDVGGRKEDIAGFFSDDPSVNWVGEVSRQQSIQLSRNSDIGFALRSGEIDNDNSQELSTKLFEYMSAGKPVILRPTRVHKELLGADYPLFADSIEQAAERCEAALTSVDLYQRAARMAYEAYKRFAKSVDHKQIVERLMQFAKTTILFVGHDLKFIKDVINAYEADSAYCVLIDQWQGHTRHDEAQSLKLLEQADIIFCEWGLGNIKWYSHRKKAGQKLIVRVHRQEIQRPDYLLDSDNSKIDHYIFIAPYRYEEFVGTLGLERSKAKMIFNTVDVAQFNVPKTSDAAYTLGMVGIVPWGKRFDLALDVFEQVWLQNQKYCLRIKGKLPQDFPWMKNAQHKDELALFEQQFDRVRNAPWKDSVIFDGHGNDMPEWFSHIGYLLSTSDYEGSHQAVAEGMASGATPLILPWAGAETVYPEKRIFKTVEEMVQFVLAGDMDANNTAYAYRHFDDELIVSQIRKLIESADT